MDFSFDLKNETKFVVFTSCNVWKLRNKAVIFRIIYFNQIILINAGFVFDFIK